MQINAELLKKKREVENSTFSKSQFEFYATLAPSVPLEQHENFFLRGTSKTIQLLSHAFWNVQQSMSMRVTLGTDFEAL